jgi:hypothetical protein
MLTMATSTRTKALESTLDAIEIDKVWVDFDLATQIVEESNSSNRPLTTSIAKRYMHAILEGRWGCSPDTIGFDADGELISGQHRLWGLIFAENLRREDPEYVKNVYGITKPIELPFIFTRGFRPQDADSVDIGKTRTGADVLARRHLFGDENSDAQNKKMHKELAVASRLLWTRINGKTVAGSGVFAHHELKTFVDEHAQLIDCVRFIRDSDYGESNDRLVANYISIGFASGLLALMQSVDEEKGEEFWTLFAAGALSADHPISRYKQFLLDMRNAGTVDRDHQVNAAIKAFKLFLAGEEKTTKTKIKPKKNERPFLPEGLDRAPMTADEIEAEKAKVNAERERAKERAKAKREEAKAAKAEERAKVKAEKQAKADKAKADKEAAIEKVKPRAKKKAPAKLSDKLDGEADHMTPKFG